MLEMNDGFVVPVGVVIKTPEPIGEERVFGVLAGETLNGLSSPVWPVKLDVCHGQRESKSGRQRRDSIRFFPCRGCMKIVVVKIVDAADIPQ